MIAFEEDTRAAKRAIGKAYRHTANYIVQHLVPAHDPEWIGAGVAVDLHTKHIVGFEQVVCVFSSHQSGIV